MPETGRTRVASGRRLFVRKGSKFYRLREAQRRFRKAGLSGAKLREALEKWGRQNKIIRSNKKRPGRTLVSGVSSFKRGENKTKVSSTRGGKRTGGKISRTRRLRQLGGTKAAKRIPGPKGRAGLKRATRGTKNAGKRSQTRRLKRK